MKAFAVLTHVLHIQPSELWGMTADDVAFWLEVSREALRHG